MSEYKSKTAQMLDRLNATAKRHKSNGHWQAEQQARNDIKEINIALHADFAELQRLRDEARQRQYNTTGSGWHNGKGGADAYETAARLLGRELPEWKPGKGEK